MAPKADWGAELAPKAELVVPKAEGVVPKAEAGVAEFPKAELKADVLEPNADAVVEAPKAEAVEPKMDVPVAVLVAPNTMLNGPGVLEAGVLPPSDKPPKAELFVPKAEVAVVAVVVAAPKADTAGAAAEGNARLLVVVPNADVGAGAAKLAAAGVVNAETVEVVVVEATPNAVVVVLLEVVLLEGAGVTMEEAGSRGV